jgi:hypothetical protein
LRRSEARPSTHLALNDVGEYPADWERNRGSTRLYGFITERRTKTIGLSALTAIPTQLLARQPVAQSLRAEHA